MNERIILEPVRVLFHLNGYTKVLLERTAGVGLADGGIVWEISTDMIPAHLRQIGSRFLVEYTPLSLEERDDLNAIRDAKNRMVIRELNEGKE
jgi:hypothetical protein